MEIKLVSMNFNRSDWSMNAIQSLLSDHITGLAAAIIMADKVGLLYNKLSLWNSYLLPV